MARAVADWRSGCLISRRMAALCVIAAAACSSGSNHGRAQTLPSTTVGPGPAASTAPRAATNLDCSSPIGPSPEPPAGYEEVAGAVALTTSTSSASALQTSASGRADPDAAPLRENRAAREDRCAGGHHRAAGVGRPGRGRVGKHDATGADASPDRRTLPGRRPVDRVSGRLLRPPTACVELIVRVASIDHADSVGVASLPRAETATTADRT